MVPFGPPDAVLGRAIIVLVARRSYGSGRLFVRADGNGAETWYASWYVGGRRVKRRIGPKRRASCADGLTRTQAEAQMRALIATTTVVAIGSRHTVAEAGEIYVTHLEVVMERKRSTIADYRGYMSKHLGPFFGGRPMDKIDRTFVEAYLLAKKREGLSSKTVCNHLNFLHGLWSFAVKREWVAKNVVALVDRPPMPRFKERRIQFLTPEELEAVVRVVPDDYLGEIERPLYLCAAMTGLCQGELIALRWYDVDWAASRVRVADSYVRGEFDSPKNHRGRSVPMADRLAGELERHFQRTRWRGENDLVFAHPATGNVLDASKLRKRFNDTLARAEVRRITFHGLRHTFGTQMAAAGAPMRAIQEWMGHADISTTEIYAHYAPDPTGGAKFADRAFGSGGDSDLPSVPLAS
jgi:integrase